MPEIARRDSEEEYRTTNLELFYDLVFVFAVTQVSHLLLDHLSWQGAGQAAIVLLVIWWAWQYTTWVTNELDPDAIPVRLLLLALMLASLLMSVAIPEAFGAEALLFAGAYVAIQVGRHTFLAYAAAGPGTVERRRALRILAWFVFAGVFWIAGAVAGGSARTALWLIALIIDYGAPLITYRIPGLPPISAETWHVSAAHFTERFQLFIIIALGETIVATGATTSSLHLSAERLTAFAIAFVGTAALWWLYFNYVAYVTERRLERMDERTDARTTMARDVFTYGHAVIVAAIIVCAVGDELVIAHPGEALSRPELVALVAGPTLYLLSHQILRLRMSGVVSWRRLIGAVGCVLVGLLATPASALVISILLTAVLIGVIVSEYLIGRRRGPISSPEAEQEPTGAL